MFFPLKAVGYAQFLKESNGIGIGAKETSPSLSFHAATFPPSKLRASSTIGTCPVSTKCLAVLNPDKPAPMTITLRGCFGRVICFSSATLVCASICVVTLSKFGREMSAMESVDVLAFLKPLVAW